MYNKYLVTGATGFLGRAVADELVRRGANVYALVLPCDPFAELLPKEVHTVTGDVCDEDSLDKFFADADSRTCVIHCAGIISIATKPGAKLFRVNVGGTRNILHICKKRGVGKLIYVSSVHAIPEKPHGCVMTEDCEFLPKLVEGYYAKSKAAATRTVFSAARHGLNISVVFPSGIIGPGDVQCGSFTSMAKAFIKGKLPLAVRGGYNFVDVRDVAKGVLDCAEEGEPGKGYILSGHYITIRRLLQIVGKAADLDYRPVCMPLWTAKLAAPFSEKYCLKQNKPLLFTPYSIMVLGSNGMLSHEAATRRFGYHPRPIEETVRDMTKWILRHE